MPSTINNLNSGNFNIVATKQQKNWSEYLNKIEGKAISFSNIKKIPYNSIGKLFIDEGNGALQFGSAFKVAPNIAMTAAHCMGKVIEERPYYFDDITYCPTFPYKRQYTVTGMLIPDAYINDNRIQNDYGFLIFDTEIPGDILLLEASPEKEGSSCSIGYPHSYNYFGNKMVEAKGEYTKPYEEKMIVMSGVDMRSGSSGGPILDECTMKVISLNSGNIGKPHEKQMSGPLMREEILTELQNIIDSLKKFA